MNVDQIPIIITYLLSFYSKNYQKYSALEKTVILAHSTDRSFYSMLLLVSGINSRLLSINHTLISPILFHPVLRVALLPLVSPTHHSRQTSPLKPFCKSVQPLPSFFQDCLPILLSISAFPFQHFPLFFVVGSVR